MIKTKTISAGSASNLDIQIARFLNYQISNSKVIDIKFSMTGDEMTGEYCAMVIYKWGKTNEKLWYIEIKTKSRIWNY